MPVQMHLPHDARTPQLIRALPLIESAIVPSPTPPLVHEGREPYTVSETWQVASV